jgi:hypothetical protein
MLKRPANKRKAGVDLKRDPLVPLKNYNKKKRGSIAKPKTTGKQIKIKSTGVLQLRMLTRTVKYTITVTLTGPDTVLQKLAQKRKYKEFEQMYRENLKKITDNKSYANSTTLYVMFMKRMIHQHLTKSAATGLKLSDESFYNKIREKGITIEFDTKIGRKKVSSSRTTPPTVGRIGSRRLQDDMSAEEYLGETLFLGLKF